MALTKPQYDAIMRMYNERQLRHQREQGVRSMADVEQRDAEHQKRKKTADVYKRQAVPRRTVSGRSFPR